MPKKVNRKNRIKRKSGNPLVTRAEVKKVKSGLDFNRRRQRVKLNDFRSRIVFVLCFAAVILLSYAIISLFGIRISVIGRSMEPTLYEGDMVVMNKLGTKLLSPSAGNMIAFLPQGDQDAEPSIKRVIGEPGDRVRIENGAIYVNDKLYEEGTTTDYISEAGLAVNEILLKSDEYFVLGDNRNNSQDSRYESVGNIKKKDMLGVVWLRLGLGGAKEED